MNDGNPDSSTSDAYSAMSREDRRHVQMTAFKRWWDLGCPDLGQEEKRWEETKAKRKGECPVCNRPCAVDAAIAQDSEPVSGPVEQERTSRPTPSGDADDDDRKNASP